MPGGLLSDHPLRVIWHAGTNLLPEEVAAFEKSLSAYLPPERPHVARPRDTRGFYCLPRPSSGGDWEVR